MLQTELKRSELHEKWVGCEMKKYLFVVSLLIFTTFSGAVDTQYKYYGLDKFTTTEKQKILYWLDVAQTATEQTIGQYPFPVNLHIAARKANEPVPWANTWREGTQSIYFYVETRFSRQQFIDDWTAYHELSHLALPYLGSQNRWFAEGFASFMQYQIMSNAGVLKKSVEQSYQFKLSPHLAKYQNDDSAMETIHSLFRNRQYKAGYWASAWFFILADQQLQLQDSSMIEIVREYLDCCRMKDDTLNDVIASWDKIAPRPLFSKLINDFNNTESRSIFPR